MKKKLMSARKAGVVVAATIGMAGLLLALQAFDIDGGVPDCANATQAQHDEQMNESIDGDLVAAFAAGVIP